MSFVCCFRVLIKCMIDVFCLLPNIGIKNDVTYLCYLLKCMGKQVWKFR